jgi:phage baseplate assembly protein W
MRPDFGSGVAQLLFEPNSPELAGTVEMLVHGALTQWLSELITVSAVHVEAEESTLRVHVTYARRGETQPQVQTFTLGTPS